MASYVLYSDKECPDDIVKPQTQKTRDSKNISIEGMLEHADKDTQGDFEVIVKKHAPAQFKQARPEIEQSDLERIPALQPMTDYINALIEYEPHAPKEIRWQVKSTIKNVRQERYIVKKQWDKPIEFKSLGYTSTEYTFDEDTGYFDDNGDYHLVSQNVIDLGNPKHILEIINHYSRLKEDHIDDTNSDMRFILDVVDDLVENTPLGEVFSRVLVRRIDGASLQDIQNELREDLGIKTTIDYLSYSLAKTIPKLIAETYESSYENWYYTYKAKGKYKKCTGQCGLLKLLSPRYFHRDSNSKDGYVNKCKVCRKKGG